MAGITHTVVQHRVNSKPLTSEETLQRAVLEDWKNEIKDRINKFQANNECFLSTFVPSNAPNPPPADLSGLFVNWKVPQGGEVGTYPELVRTILIHNLH